jgi:hypothetical protein
LRGNLIILVTHLPDIGNLCIIGLTEQPGESGGVEERIFASVHRHHPKPERFVPYRGAEFRECL